MLRRDFLRSAALFTGSIAFGVGTRNSDEDYLLDRRLASDAKVGRTQWQGDYPLEFRSYREGNINVIVFFHPEFERRWYAAHDHCMIERPREKSRRIKIFRHYLYGEPLHK